ncbi:hypothetical protein MTO96_015573 [Rhipicephalus appendiculatus]
MAERKKLPPCAGPAVSASGKVQCKHRAHRRGQEERLLSYHLTPEGISGEGRDSSEKLTWSSRQTNLGSRQSNLGSGERKTHTDSVWTEPTSATPRSLVSSRSPGYAPRAPASVKCYPGPQLPPTKCAFEAAPVSGHPIPYSRTQEVAPCAGPAVSASGKVQCKHRAHRRGQEERLLSYHLTPEGISGEGRDSSEKLTWSSRQTNLGSRQSNLGSGERKTHTDSVWTEPTSATPRSLVSSRSPGYAPRAPASVKCYPGPQLPPTKVPFCGAILVEPERRRGSVQQQRSLDSLDHHTALIHRHHHAATPGSRHTRSTSPTSKACHVFLISHHESERVCARHAPSSTRRVPCPPATLLIWRLQSGAVAAEIAIHYSSDPARAARSAFFYIGSQQRSAKFPAAVSRASSAAAVATALVTTRAGHGFACWCP